MDETLLCDLIPLLDIGMVQSRTSLPRALHFRENGEITKIKGAKSLGVGLLLEFE